MESQIEKVINQVTSSDLFLRGISTLINFNSYRKIFLQKALEKMLKELELPIRRDQERLLAMVQELEIRIKKLQLNDELKSAELVEVEVAPRIRQKVIKSKKSSTAKRIN